MKKFDKYLAEIADIAKENKLQIACSESLTSGLVQSLLGRLSGSSDFFVGGVCAYNIDQKVNLLTVEREHAKKVNCVSYEVANQMAQGTLKLFDCDIALSTTGYAEAYPSEGVLHPYAYIAIHSPTMSVQHFAKVEAPDNVNTRTEMQEHVAGFVIATLAEILRIHYRLPKKG